MNAWIVELSPWTEALRGHLSLPIDEPAPHRSDLYDSLWIQFQLPADPTRHDSVVWVEALRLLQLLAVLDRCAYWDLIVDLCSAREKLRTLGCPLEFLVPLRPRYELRVPLHGTLSHETMALLLDCWHQISQSTGGVSSESAPRCSLADPASFHLSPLNKQVLVWATRIASLQGSATSQFTLDSMAVDFATGVPVAREFVRQIACKVPLLGLKVQGQFAFEYEHLYGPFLWRMLAPHGNARATLGLYRLEIDTTYLYCVPSQQYVALLSAVASSRTLRELSFHEGVDAYGVRRLPEWLAFALFSQTALHEIHAVRLTFGKHMKDFVVATKRLVDNETMSTSSDHVLDWPPTVVLVKPQAHVFGFDVPQGHTTKTVYHGMRPVNCLVQSQEYGSAIQILIPGVGSGCVDRNDVLGVPFPAPRRATHSIRHLSLGVYSRLGDYNPYRNNRLPFDTASVLEMVRRVGAPLLSLTVRSVGVQAEAPLLADDLLVSCLQLQRLTLVNLTLSVEKLFASRHGQALQSFTLIDCNVLDNPRPLRSVRTSAYIAPFVFPRLTSLYVDSAGKELHEYVLEIAIQRNLHRLVVKCSEEKMRARYAAHVQRHDGTLIPVLALRPKLAFLSVVSVGPSQSSTPKYTLRMDVVESIFEMVSTTMRRRVYTLLE